jgi:hypothetical protein
MKVVLDFWNRRWQSVTFDPLLGVGRVRWLARKPSRCVGWAYRHDGHWYAVRLEQEEVVFQSGVDVWPMIGDLQCENVRRGTARTFTIRAVDRVVMQIKYDGSPELDDLNSDRLDLETTDFFYWTARVWNDPDLKRTLAAAWRKAELTA